MPGGDRTAFGSQRADINGGKSRRGSGAVKDFTVARRRGSGLGLHMPVHIFKRNHAFSARVNSFFFFIYAVGDGHRSLSGSGLAIAILYHSLTVPKSIS